MAKQKTRDGNSNALTRVVQKGFATMAKGFAAVADDIDRLKTDVHHLPTRSDVGTMIDNSTHRLASELTSIHKDLEALTGTVDNLTGLPKEIDHALERIADIEKHLGINEKITA